MDIQDILRRFDNVKGSNGQYTAKCPCHDDRRNSLSISVGDDGKTLLHCHTNKCKPEDIVRAKGLTMRDLFTDSKIYPEYKDENPGKWEFVATYKYGNDIFKYRKKRGDDKSFSWKHRDEQGKWVWKKPAGKLLYTAGDTFQAGQTVIVVEGEKDTDSLHRLGYAAACGPDGAGNGKWRDYADQEPLRGCRVYVLPDNDDVGREYAEETCSCLYGVAESVHLLDLSTVWPEISNKGDVSDMVQALGDEEACIRLTDLMSGAKPWKPNAKEEKHGLLSMFQTLEEFTEEEATWTVSGWIPEAQITLFAADGGVGKTSTWVNIAASLSSGHACILDPPGYMRNPMKVLFCTTEDSVKKKLRKKLREAGADLSNIIAMDTSKDKDGELKKLKFGTKALESVVRELKPDLCIFDPVQGFIPPEINMGSRNAMRDCMAPLISLGEETGTTFLVVCHTNKRKGAFGRDRIADSADLWDISRSVIMAGYTGEQGIRYLSNEKNNYSALQETILFSVNDAGQVEKEGTSWKRDRDYMLESVVSSSPSKREECKTDIIRILEGAGGSMESDLLSRKLESNGHKFETVKRAKKELKDEKRIRYYTTGSAKNLDRVWHVTLVGDVEFKDLPNDTETPFEVSPSA